jgi:simple sugar transport system ATP-binding protein
VLAVSDRVAVLRQGRLIAVREAATTSKAELAELMVGRRIEAPVHKAPTLQGETGPRLSVRGIAVGDKLQRAEFDVERGEIFGRIE